MSDKHNSVNDSEFSEKKSMRKVFSKAINVGLLAMLGGGSAVAAPIASHSISRRANRNAVVYVAENAASSLTSDVKAEQSAQMIKPKRQAFSSFGKSQKKMEVVKAEPNNAALKFLQDNDLLKTNGMIGADISGEILGRKVFAHEAPAAHCHGSFRNYYTSTSSFVSVSNCVNSLHGTWFPASTKPFLKNPNVVNKTSTSFQVNFAASKSSTAYAVLLNASAVAPSSAQVIAGTDGSGNAAVQATSQAVTTNGSFSFTGLTAGLNYIVYVAAIDAGQQVTPTPLQGNPAFETALIDNVPSWKFPKVRTNSVGDFYLAQASAANGNSIVFRKWNGSSFANYAAITTATTGAYGVSWGNEQRVDYEVDSAGRIYAIFSEYQGQMAITGDPYFGYYNGTTWTFTKIAETGDGVDNVDVFIDTNGKVHASFITRNTGQYVLYYATNKTGSWVISTITTATGGTDEIHDSYVVADTSGNATVVYRREDNQNDTHDNYYIAYSTNAFASPTIILNGKVDAKIYKLAGLKIDANNKLHYAYANTTNRTSFYVTNASGSWVSTPISKGAHYDITVQGFERVGTTNYFASYSNVTYFMTSFDGTNWIDGFDFNLKGYMNDRFAISDVANRIMYASEDSNDWTIYYHTAVMPGYITPAAPNNPPTDIALTAATVNQSAGANAVVGTLNSTDADSGNTHTYSLVAGAGDTNNASFNISGTSLRLTTPTSLAGGTYSVRIRTTDNAGGTFDKGFTITVVDNVAPSVSSIVLTGSPTSAATSVTFTVTFGESANNISVDDFVLTATGTAAATIASVSASSGSSVTVTVNTISGTGTLRLDLKASTNITDAAGNGNGTNGYSASFNSGSTHTVAVPTVPSAPTSPIATPGNGQVSVAFTAPGNTGGASITGYTVTSSPGGITATGSGSPIVVTGLTNGTAYTFTVTATNSVGTGSSSTASGSVTPQATQSITFGNPGAQNFGTSPTLTATSSSGLTTTFTSATTGVCTITTGGALTFVAAGICTINTNQAGNAAYTAASQVSQSFTINAVVPSAPTVGTATAGDTQATITFIAPSSTGGASITGYTVTSNPAGITATGSNSPITVTGLTNGIAYTFTITATNSAGTGSASSATNSITPAATQTITFSNPGAQNFGTTPTLTATSDSGLTPTFTSSTTGVCTITSGGALTFISTGTCTINSSQTGNSSYLAATPVSRSFTVNAVAPGAPVIGTVTPGDTQATVTFTPPASNGGGSITGYTVTASPGGATATGTGSPITITGLTNGVNYTFTVTATTSAGTGSSSGVSGSVAPAASQSITFNDPGTQNFGSMPSLSATSSSGLPVGFSTPTAGVCTVNSLGVVSLISVGTCTITVSQAGNSTFLPATPVSRTFSVVAVVPAAPTIGTATGGNGQATVTFATPGFNGGVAVTGYTVTANPGGITASGPASPIVVTGLTNGVTYTFTVTATNLVGTGPASVASNAITPVATQTITFTDPGTQSLGTTPTFSATSSSGLVVSFISTTTSVCTITSGGLLTLIASGTCTVEASQAGNGAYQAATTVTRSFSVVAAVPGAPTIGTVTATSGQATVTFTAPTVTGSSAITGYTVTSSPGGITATGTSSPIVVTGLTDGVAYTFTVTATSSAGTGTASATSTAVTPKTSQTVTFANPGSQTVGVPLNLSATASSGLAVTFTSATPAVCIVSLGGVTFLSAGTCTINGEQAGNTVYAAAPTITQSFVTQNAVDPLAPVLTVPADLQIDATALYTPITLRQLLRLANNSTQTELDTGLDKLATDTSGKSCCTTIADGVSATQPLLLPPGRHQVKWTATNQAGVKTSGVQTLDVRPLVSLSKSQIALRGTNTEFRIILNGPSPTYPLTVSYVLDEATTATTAEHTLTSGTATLANNGQLEVAVPVTLNAVSGVSDSQIVVRLTGDINIGATNRHTISIREGNVPPTVNLSLTQGSFPTTTITPNGGPVTVTARVTDLNVGDTHTFDWSATSGLPDTDGNLTNATRVFDPAGLTGSHQVNVTVADSGGAQVQAQLYFHVAPSLPVLSAIVDTDGDGIADELEGTGDADGNGIPDYLDNMRSSNILPQKVVTTDKYLIECDPGVRCGLGLLALSSSTGGVQILDSEVATLPNLKADSSFTPVGGIFDFAVADLPTAGQSINIAIPQIAPIPVNAVYRKFQKGQWVNFVENADNVLRSAIGNPGYCPPPGSAEWKSGLVAGSYCVQLTISDGGPNDGDGIVNSAVVDPGAVSVAVTVVPPVEPPVNPPALPPVEIKTKGKGGAVDYTLLILMGGLLLMHRRSKLFALGTLLLVAVNTQAASFSDKTYLRLDVYKVNGSQSEYEFNSALANEGYDFTLTKYDVNRTGSQISIGYKWNENVYTELGYLDLGDVKVNLWLAGSEDQTAFGKSFARHYPNAAGGATLVQGIKLPFNNHWSVSPELGVFVWKEEVEVNGAEFRIGDKSNTDLLVGLRLDYQITKSFGLGLGVRSILFKDDTVNLWGVSTRWNF